MGSTHSIILLFVASALWRPAASMAEEGEGTPSNLRTFQVLSQMIGDSAIALIPHGDTVKVLATVRPEGSAWMLEGPIIQSLQAHGFIVVAALPAAYRAEFGINEMQVTYRDIRREGIFGRRVVDRDVALELQAKLTDDQTGALLMSRSIRKVAHDTVGVSEIERLEDPNIPVTHAPLPPEGFFTSFAEPVVMLGAIAVAVYLLFTVRS